MSLTLDSDLGIGKEGAPHEGDDDSGINFLNREVVKAIEGAGEGVASIIQSQLRVRLAGLIEQHRTDLEKRVGFHFSTKALLEKIQPRFSGRIASDAAKIVRESAGVDFSVQAGALATSYLEDVTDDDLVAGIKSARGN